MITEIQNLCSQGFYNFTLSGSNKLPFTMQQTGFHKSMLNFFNLLSFIYSGHHLMNIPCLYTLPRDLSESPGRGICQCIMPSNLVKVWGIATLMPLCDVIPQKNWHLYISKTCVQQAAQCTKRVCFTYKIISSKIRICFYLI